MHIPSSSWFKRFLNSFLGYFMRGMLLIIPFALTLYIISVALKRLDSLVKINIPGVGMLIVFTSIAFIGYVASHILIRSMLDGFERFMLRLPLINLIYSSFKEFFTAFLGDKKKFEHPVLIKMNAEPAVWKIGFVTKSSLGVLNMVEKTAVYVPHSYAFSGDLYIVDSVNLVSLAIPSADAMKFIVSGGVTRLQQSSKAAPQGESV